MEPRSSRTGIGLVEVLLVVALTGVLASGYLIFLTGHVDDVQDLRLRTRAMLRAQQVLEEARHELPRSDLDGFRPRSLELGEMSGTMDVRPFAGRPTLYEVTVSVRWTSRSGGPEHRLTLSRLVRPVTRPVTRTGGERVAVD